jgi:hypothetical protein
MGFCDITVWSGRPELVTTYFMDINVYMCDNVADLQNISKFRRPMLFVSGSCSFIKNMVTLFKVFKIWATVPAKGAGGQWAFSAPALWFSREPSLFSGCLCKNSLVFQTAGLSDSQHDLPVWLQKFGWEKIEGSLLFLSATPSKILMSFCKVIVDTSHRWRSGYK